MDILLAIIQGAGIFLALPSKAHAYLDPGTGSYVFQLLVAGLLGGSFFFKSIYKKIKGKLKKDTENEKTTSSDK